MRILFLAALLVLTGCCPKGYQECMVQAGQRLDARSIDADAAALAIEKCCDLPGVLASDEESCRFWRASAAAVRRKLEPGYKEREAERLRKQAETEERARQEIARKVFAAQEYLVEHGWTPDPKVTWDEVIALAEKIQQEEQARTP